MGNIIEIEGLTKQYGKLTALNNLSLSVEEGDVVGFIGPNGAGKTTTIRLLTTLLKPTRGQARIAGYSVSSEPQMVRKVIGYMPDFFGVYDDMKVWEYLDFFAACYGIRQRQRMSMIDDLLALVDLNHKKETYVDNLSRGMKQRLCLARTLTHDPQVLILDEPASGLDPRARIEMRELLRELRNMGKTIFFSSHILSEVADICSSIAILEAGNLVAYGNMAEMKRQLTPHRIIEVKTLDQFDRLQEALMRVDLVHDISVYPDGNLEPNTIRFNYAGDDLALSRVLVELIRQDIPVISFNEESGDLEDVFMRATKGIVN